MAQKKPLGPSLFLNPPEPGVIAREILRVLYAENLLTEVKKNGIMRMEGRGKHRGVHSAHLNVGITGASMKFFSAFLIAVLPLLAACNHGGSTPDAVGRLFTRDGLDNVKLAVELYLRESGRYPESLDELIAQKRISRKNIVKDAWGRKYHYALTGESYALFSAGPDGMPYTEDDVRPSW